MKIKRFLVFFVVVLMALTLAACQRSASTPPPDVETFPTLEGTTDPMDALEGIATQTAVAQSPEGEGEEGGETAPEDETSEESPPPEEAEPTVAPDPEEDTPDEPAEPPKEYPVPDKHTLQKGEFPYCIARRFDISPGALLAANNLTSSSVTYAGQVLTIPKDAGSFDAGPRELKAHPDNYTVIAGDTVFSIACQYGSVDPRAIEDANGLEGAYTLQVGDVLKIP
jgi:LysM repeat protein